MCLYRTSSLDWVEAISLLAIRCIELSAELPVVNDAGQGPIKI